MPEYVDTEQEMFELMETNPRVNKIEEILVKTQKELLLINKVSEKINMYNTDEVLFDSINLQKDFLKRKLKHLFIELVNARGDAITKL